MKFEFLEFFGFCVKILLRIVSHFSKVINQPDNDQITQEIRQQRFEDIMNKEKEKDSKFLTKIAFSPQVTIDEKIMLEICNVSKQL